MGRSARRRDGVMSDQFCHAGRPSDYSSMSSACGTPIEFTALCSQPHCHPTAPTVMYSLPPAFCTENASIFPRSRCEKMRPAFAGAFLDILLPGESHTSAICVTDMLSDCPYYTLVIRVKTSIDFNSTTQRFIETPTQSPCYNSVKN